VANRVTREMATELMRVIDDAIRELLAARGLEAFRFDADVNGHEWWLQIKVKVRPTADVHSTEPPLWSVRCRTCESNDFPTTPVRSMAITWKRKHLLNHPGHDALVISIPKD
jgi:hypothetical protein